MNCMLKHTGLGLALGAALSTGFAVVSGHAGVLIAIGIGVALGVIYWRKELPSLAAARRQASKTKANS